MRRAVASPPALHRCVNNLPSWIVADTRRVLDEHGGDAERIWNDDPTAEDLRGRLERRRGTGIRRLEGTGIAFDVHVRRVFLRTGIAERDDQQHMVGGPRRLNPDRPGALDYT